MVMRRREGETVRVDESRLQRGLPANQAYQPTPVPVQRAAPDIQPVIHPLELLERAIERLRVDFQMRLHSCASPEERLQLTSALVTLIDDVRAQLISVSAPVESSALPLEVVSWTAGDIVQLIDSYQVTKQNIGLVLQWITLHTSFKSHMKIGAASGVANSVIGRFNTGWYQKSPYEIPNGAKLLQWIRAVAEKRILRTTL